MHQYVTAFVLLVVAQAPGWVGDATRATIPNRPAAGMIHGARFTVEKAELSGGDTKDFKGRPLDHSTWFIHLRSGKDFFADKEFVIFIATKAGETLDGRIYTLKMGSNFKQPVGVHVGNTSYPAIQGLHMSYKVPGKSLPETEMFMDKTSLRLEFGKTAGVKLPGRLYLCVQDPAKSWVAGTFNAVRSRF
jgi:hypothetical protein